MATKTNKCTFCKARFPTDMMTSTPAGRFCTHEHAIAYAQAYRDKAMAKHVEKQRKEHRKAKRDNDRTNLNWQHEKTQKAFNKMRRLEEFKWFADRGLEPVCISCSRELGGDQWCAGHYKTRGAQSGLRYDPMNVYLQHNVHCNRELSGDIAGTKTTHGYKKGLIIRFGDEEGQRIIDYCERNTDTVKWCWQELEEMRSEYACNSRELMRLLQ